MKLWSPASTSSEEEDTGSHLGRAASIDAGFREPQESDDCGSVGPGREPEYCCREGDGLRAESEG